MVCAISSAFARAWRGLQAPAREDQLLRERRAEDARQELGAADPREDAERRLRHAEDRRLAGHDEIREERQLAPPGEREALDRGDHRHRAAEQGEGAALEEVVLGAPARAPPLVALLEVAPRAEGPVARAGEHDGAHRAVAL